MSWRATGRRVALAVTRYAAGRERTPVIVVGNSLGGCVALRLAERHPAMLAGVVGAAPAGLEMHRLLHLVQHDPLVRSLVSLPSPVPAAVMRAAVARIYCRLAFAAPARSIPSSSRRSPTTTAGAGASPSTWTSPTA